MIAETINAITQAHMALATALPTGFTHTPSSVSSAVSGISNAAKTASDAVPPVAGIAGGSIAGLHAIGKASTVDPQKIQRHTEGIKHGIVGGLVGIGAGSIITIAAHIL